MKAVLQRVSKGSVMVEGKTVGEIGHGLVILLGVQPEDSETQCSYLAGKIADMRIFGDENGKMNLSIKDVVGSALVVSQFTLMADWKKGRRPAFTSAAPPDQANRLYEHFCSCLEQLTVPVQKGVFAADMKVELINDGPVTLVLDTN